MKLYQNKNIKNEIISLVTKKHSRKEISEILNVSKSTVDRLMKNLNLFSKYRESKNIKINCKECDCEFNSNIASKRKFCSRNCSAIFNNKNRKHTEETKQKISKTLTRNEGKERKKKIRYCKSCNSSVMIDRKSICEICKFSYYKYYRPNAEFNFDIYIYKDKFDLELVDKYGWYSPLNKGNNLKGVSKDHMYSVKDGFNNNINPEIISHPANCKLLLHSENNRKKTESSITIEELLERIKNW